MGPMPEGPGILISLGLCRVPLFPEFPIKLVAYRDDCMSPKDVELTEDANMLDDDIEFCKRVAFNDILRPIMMLFKIDRKAVDMRFATYQLHFSYCEYFHLRRHHPPLILHSDAVDDDYGDH